MKKDLLALRKVLLAELKKHPTSQSAEINKALEIVNNQLQAKQDLPSENEKSWFKELLLRIMGSFFSHLLEDEYDDYTSNDDKNEN